MTPPDATLTAEEARKELYAVMHRDLDFLVKARRALEIGTAYLGVENGHIARIETATNYWESLKSTDPPDGEYPAGLTVDLGTTYCRRTIQQKSPLALHNVPEQGWENDPAFETHGFIVTTGYRFMSTATSLERLVLSILNHEKSHSPKKN
ncbi:hypothetical protein ACLI4Y_16375 [Natrialbaceae archaeon A-CW3]